MDGIYIVGIGMTRFGRHLECSLDHLANEAIQLAVKDAGCAINDLGIAYYTGITNHLQDQTSIPGQVVLSKCGVQGIPIVNVEGACASGTIGLNMAIQSLLAGSYDTALVLASEKMHIPDKARAFKVFDGGWDVANSEENAKVLTKLSEGFVAPEGSESDRPYSLFMKIYAAMCIDHIQRYGTSQRQIAAVASKNHNHSVHNPLAQFNQAMSIEEVLAAPPITFPLTLPMCAPLSDGAAAIIVCNEYGLKRIGADKRRTIAVKASVIGGYTLREWDDFENHCETLASKKAYDIAGLGPEDINVAEVHDASAAGEIFHVENLKFVPRGEGGPAAERGEFSLGGRLPVNTSGGLVSKGHPIGATGLGQLHELVTQLRGEAGARQVEGARIALQENSGGLIGVEEAAVGITILSQN
ncbi:thiolase family protein [Spongiibacter sp. KMU-166]|uniref:propanoyl-CoA C-acyltransferase n=1 Tax=Spongiibacter thalassae TaxID=2721624 RepID=A0ABX1GB98_9GAMM|nr:thiolase family protein [Spongiibacter thalassae]NKI16245.1 thiolase family protein [Spongiibacter thalassae]